MVPWEQAKVPSMFQLLLRGVIGVAGSQLDSISPAAPGRDAWEGMEKVEEKGLGTHANLASALDCPC